MSMNINNIDINRYKIIMEEQKKFVSSWYNESEKYTKAIIALGYVGFFSIFNIIKDSINQHDKAIIGISITISISFFIIWEIGKMTYTYLSILKYYDFTKTPSDKFLEAQKKLLNGTALLTKIGIVFWIIFLVIIIGSGIISLGFLLKAFLQSLF